MASTPAVAVTASSSSSSSFAMLSDHPRLSSSDNDSDEILYSVSEDFSDSDFVVLSRQRSANSIMDARLMTPSTEGDDALANEITKLSIIDSASVKRTKRGSRTRRKKGKTKPAVAPKGSQPRSAESDDSSDKFSNGDSEPSKYDEAVCYITSFLSNPDARNNPVCRLTFLQALIIELGLASSALPASLTSARAFLKSRVFLNIREYLAVRGQGADAVQRAMHPSRKALIKDIKKNKQKRASLGWVKESGLQVLLVKCY